MSIKHLLNPAGGLYYHAKALLFRANWPPFVERLADWLNSWQPTHKNLVIIGASAGYTLKRDFLMRFSSLSAIDPDPLARHIFAYRFPGLKISWSSKEYLRDSKQLKFLLADHPEHSFLFANILGQRPLLFAATDLGHEQWCSQFETLFANKSWASYHDRISSSNSPTISELQSRHFLSTDELISRFFAEKKALYLDHQTEIRSNHLDHYYLTWQLTPWQHHVLEAIHS